jgi:hypothetical protein
MAPLRHIAPVRRCPFIGVDRKSPGSGQTDAIDPLADIPRLLSDPRILNLSQSWATQSEHSACKCTTPSASTASNGSVPPWKSTAACLRARLLSPLVAQRRWPSRSQLSNVRRKPPPPSSPASNFRRPIRNSAGSSRRTPRPRNPGGLRADRADACRSDLSAATTTTNTKGGCNA